MADPAHRPGSTASKTLEPECDGSNDGDRSYARGVQAAFFDLDKTVIAKAAMLAFGPHLRRAGLLNRWLVVRAVWGQLVFRYLGADEDRMTKMRRTALKVCTGWEKERIGTLVDETLTEVIEPLVFDEAVELIDPSPPRRPPRLPGIGLAGGDRPSARPPSRCRRRHRQPGLRRRRWAIHRRDRVLRRRRIQSRGHARAGRPAQPRPERPPTRTPTPSPTYRCSRPSATRWRSTPTGPCCGRRSIAIGRFRCSSGLDLSTTGDLDRARPRWPARPGSRPRWPPAARSGGGADARPDAGRWSFRPWTRGR